MTEKPSHSVPTICDVQQLRNNGPWPTKSNGHLNVLFGISFTDLQEKYFHYEESELVKISQDVRGLRSYTVAGLQKQAVGANEWHRLRNELVFTVKGRVLWTCEDVFGNKSEHTLDSQSGIWVPPFILHTYESLEDDSELLVVANTLFFPEDPKTHDTYDIATFRLIQDLYRGNENPTLIPALDDQYGNIINR